MIFELKEETIEGISNNYDKIILDFYSDFCTPCTIISKKLENLLDDAEFCAVIKINIDNLPKLTSKYKIKTAPTLIFIKKDKIISKLTWHITDDKLNEEILKLY